MPRTGPTTPAFRSSGFSRSFPLDLWAPIATLISWGPDIVEVRMEQAVKEMARQPTTRAGRRRPAGSHLSKGTIECRITGVWQLLDAVIGVRTTCRNRTQPQPRHRHRQRLDAQTQAHQLNHARRSPVRPGQLRTRYRTVRQTPAGTRPESPHRRTRIPRQRRRLIFSLLCLYGARVDALRTLRVEDYFPAYRFSDGTTGAALRIYPGKSWDHDQPHYLPLPPQLAEWIEQWINFTGREIGQNGEPLFPNLNPTTANKPYTYLGQAAFYSAIAGNTKGQWGCRALLPTGEDPHIGWHPHAFRHTAYQLAIRAAIKYQSEHPTQYPHIHPEEFAKALLAHKLGGTVSATYRDLNREALSVAIVPYMWTVLYDDGAIKRGPDPARIKAAREHHEALQATMSAVRADLAENEAAAHSLSQRAQRTEIWNANSPSTHKPLNTATPSEAFETPSTATSATSKPRKLSSCSPKKLSSHSPTTSPTATTRP